VKEVLVQNWFFIQIHIMKGILIITDKFFRFYNRRQTLTKRRNTYIILCLLLIRTTTIFAQFDFLKRQNQPFQTGTYLFKNYGDYSASKWGVTDKGGSTLITKLPNYLIINDSNYSLEKSKNFVHKYENNVKPTKYDTFNRQFSNLILSTPNSLYGNSYYNITDSMLYLQTEVTSYSDGSFAVEEWTNGLPIFYYPIHNDSVTSKSFYSIGVDKTYSDSIRYSLIYPNVYLSQYTIINYKGKCSYISPKGLYHYDSLLYIEVHQQTDRYNSPERNQMKERPKSHENINTYLYSPKLKKIVYFK
jgi:hypothetical protein